MPVSRKIPVGPWRLLSTIAERHRARESIKELMDDYNLSRSEILGAIAWHKKRGKAAKKGWRTRRNQKLYDELEGMSG
ncbi:hypothetical protein LCGC14_1221830 [marine sediment metagenome]|uniref:Uncharacterized protein n=1 Tax=marine sediment metagenome TaxID=412755 RepID=A0A0F9LB18_9ZZZZ